MIKPTLLTINHKKVHLDTDPGRILLWVLRTDLNLTGAKYGCGEGLCGACTVLMNNKAIRSCQYTLQDAAGKDIITIEGLEKEGQLHPLQEAFIKHEALQCGYCTPGMILGAYGLLLENPHPSRMEIIEHMDDHLCRCGSYNRIIDAILSVAGKIKAV